MEGSREIHSEIKGAGSGIVISCWDCALHFVEVCIQETSSPEALTEAYWNFNTSLHFTEDVCIISGRSSFTGLHVCFAV